MNSDDFEKLVDETTAEANRLGLMHARGLGNTPEFKKTHARFHALRQRLLDWHAEATDALAVALEEKEEEND